MERSRHRRDAGQGGRRGRHRLQKLLADAGAFFEDCFWSSAAAEEARLLLAGHDLGDKVIREFGVGYAPVGAHELLEHLRGLDYSSEEIVASGLATTSPRGRAHVHIYSRVTFPVRDRMGRSLGFAGLATHLGPSWAQWVTSPDTGLYRRSRAVFGLDRAAKRIASSKTALVLRDCVEVLRAHQEGNRNAVAVHTGSVTPEQVEELGGTVEGGVRSLKLDLAPGMTADLEPDPAGPRVAAAPRSSSAEEREVPSNLELKKTALVTGTALAAMNTWTGAPLLALWVGSQAQGGNVLSLIGVVTVLVVMGVLVFLLAWAMTWFNARYDTLVGRPVVAGLTSPWHRAKRGDRVQDIRHRYGVSAPEKVVVVSVVAGVIALEVWFFFYAGSPF